MGNGSLHKIKYSKNKEASWLLRRDHEAFFKEKIGGLELNKRRFLSAVLSFMLVAVMLGTGNVNGKVVKAAETWRSSLYPENWTPGYTNNSGQFLQDFSYAGYEKGEKEIPTKMDGLYANVLNYGADNTGAKDSTTAIQNAINAVESAGGGTVYLPAGTYKVKPASNSNASALRIKGSNILFKGDGVGKTFIRCYAESMRYSQVINVSPQGGTWDSADDGKYSYLTQDIPKTPTTTVHLNDVSNFKTGDWVIIRSDRTSAWINEHNMSGFWSANVNASTMGTTFYRQITKVNSSNKTIEIDIPTRYYMKTRDNARVYKVAPKQTNVGLSDFSIGNKANSKTSGWGEEDYKTSGTGAYEANNAFLIKFSMNVNCFAKNISTYQAGNSSQIHMTSNGLDLNKSRSITIDNCDFSHPQYEGGGGNGYGMNICAQECLIKNCSSTSARHSFSFKYSYANGNVIYHYTSTNPKYGSDFHMYLSMSNLIDNEELNGDFVESVVRPYGATAGNRHGHTSTETVFWNTKGNYYKSGSSYIIDSRQFGNGYIIGTQGAASAVKTTPLTMSSTYGTVNTNPEDYKEGIGKGTTLYPQSLYYDQLQKRLNNNYEQEKKEQEIPGTFNATEYSSATSGITKNMGDTLNYVGNLVSGSTLEYQVNAKEAGNYTMDIELAAGDVQYNAKNLSVKLDGNTVSTIPVTGSSEWTKFIKHTTQINITNAGKHTIEVVSDGGAVNVGNITFTKKVSEPVIGSAFTQNDFLKCNGTSIRNNYGKGNNVYLRGTNAGGWLVQESWMNATNTRDQKAIMASLDSRFGTEKMYKLLDVYESNYWTTSDFDNCKNLGMSVIRVPFTYMNLYQYDSTRKDWVLRSNAFQKLDWFINECSKRGIYVILDLHGAFGSQNGQDHSGEVIDNVSDVTFFSNEYNKNKTLELWKTVASHYAGNPTVAGYDTLNEPGEKAGTTNAKHWAFYNQMYQTIRAVDPDHIIIMESCWGTGNLPNPKNYGWENVMYEYHHYTWDYISDLNGQKNSCDNIIKNVNNANYGVPTYIGEFTCFGLEDAWNYVMDKFNNEGWHYTSWSYKSTNSGSWGIYNEKTTAKVNPASDSESDIRNKWGADSIGTGAQSTSGMVYRAMKANLPGTVAFAEKALTDNDYFVIKAGINNKYVCADNNGESSLIANRDSSGGWEQFRVIYNADGTISFQSRANNKYLCTVFDDTDKENPIVARSNKIGTWEKFYLEKQNNGAYALRTYVNNYYVQADINDTNAGILHAIGGSVGTWEIFTFEAVSDSSALPEVNTNPPINEGSTKYGKDYKVVAYYPNWYGNITNKVQWDKLTHCYYAFGLPDGKGNGTMESLSGQASNIQAMVQACNKNNVIPVLSVGGWSYSDGRNCSEVFANNTNSTAKCQSLAQSIVEQAKQHGFKGVDIDWEYPTNSTQSQYTTFMKELRKLSDQNGMILTVAVAATSGSGFTSEVLNMLDFVNIMAYDGDSGAGHSPYDLATRSFTYWKDTMKVPAKKLVIGVPFYERPNWASYADIVAKNADYAQQDSAVINGKTVYYNGIPTMKKKAEYAAKNAGGIMIWEISQDSTNQDLSLVNAIYNTTKSILGENEETQKPTEAETTQKPTEIQTTQKPVETTTQQVVSTQQPIEVFGLVVHNKGNNMISVTWGQNQEQIALNQKYNVYVDGEFKLTNVVCGEYLLNEISAGNRTIKVSAVLGDKETNGVQAAIVVEGQEITEKPDNNVKPADPEKNLAKKAAISASGFENEVFAPEKAVDGDSGTRWSSDFADDAWISVDLGDVYAVNKVVLNWEGAYGKAYKIQTSVDGVNWTTVKDVTDGKGGVETIMFDAVPAKYVKMQGVTRALPYGYSLWEIEVYGVSKINDVPSGTNVAKSAAVSSSGAENEVFSAEKAVDGDKGTRWSSNFADDAWISVDLGKVYTINKVVLNWEGAYGESYIIQTSTDGKTWKTVK
ncbi:MAG: cellulase family glycosylhydrolase, partial [Eubacterium sp.]|nr:cellulase family glycosylhydrolase [Eubacterium sp.]